MNCPKCKNLIPDNSLYCPACGEPLTQPDSTNVNGLPPVIAALHNVVSSKLFLVVAILFTVASAAQLINGGGLPVFEILVAIAMWIMVGSNKNGNIMGYETPLKMISGTVFANTIIFWISGGIFAVSGLIVALSGSAAEEFINVAINMGELSMDEAALLDAYGSLVFTIFGIVFIVAAVIIFLINIFIIKGMHKFTKSVLTTFRTGINQIEKLRFTKVVVLILGIITALSSLGLLLNPIALVSEASLAAAYIILYIMLDSFEKEITAKASF